MRKQRKLMNNGYIRIYRQLIEWEWFTEPNTLQVWIYCLMRANWKDNRFRGQLIPRGSFVTSQANIGEDLNLTIREVRTALNHLKSTGEITVKTTNKWSVITVENYSLYQDDDDDSDRQNDTQADTQTTTKRQSNDIQTTTNEESKESNKVIKKNINTVSKRFIPPTEEEVRLYCMKRNNSVNAEGFISFYESNGWKVGKNPMKDWKAAVITWEKRNPDAEIGLEEYFKRQALKEKLEND